MYNGDMERIILGIESSCDDTSIAVVDSNLNVINMETVSQISVHKIFGGVVPEVAARNHIAYIFPLLNRVMESAGVKPKNIDAIAVTRRPGLVGSLLVGVMAAKGLSASWNLPLIGINHLDGHIASAFLNKDKKPKKPYISLIVSGGHTSIVEVTENGQNTISQTLDDAAGEAYDKVSKMAGLGYPGGPVIDKLAQKGNPDTYDLPYLLKGGKHANATFFSYSGIKSAVKRILDEEKNLIMEDLMAAFQIRVVELIERRLESAISKGSYNALVISGGVSANSHVRKMATSIAEKHNLELYLPELKYCQDNGAMIAAAAFERFEKRDFDSLDFPVNPTVRPGK